MKRAKGDKYDAFVSLTSQRLIQIVLGVGILYIVLVTVEIPCASQETQSLIPRSVKLQTDQDLQTPVAPSRPQVDVSSATEAGKGVELSPASVSAVVPRRSMASGLNFENAWKSRGANGFWGLHKCAKVAWDVGQKFWSDLVSGKALPKKSMALEAANATESCPHSVSLSGTEFLEQKRLMVLLCGLTLGSHVTVVGELMWRRNQR